MCTEAQAILSALKHDMHWLLEESNANPSQFAPHAEQLYSLMNIMQLVTSRFAMVCNDNDTASQAVVREVMASDFERMGK
jgi:hypothetical protein